MGWLAITDRLCPFIHDSEQRGWYRERKHARPDEIARKLHVRRVNILNGNDVPRFTREQEVLWRIDIRRQRRSDRRGHITEALAWLGAPAALVAGHVGIATLLWIDWDG
jgi:hypothetical protein